jgi:excisionase family DNA binding protein
MDQLLLKPEEVAVCLNIGRSTVYELMRSGVLELVQIGTRRRITRAAVERYVASLPTQRATS